MDFKFDQLYLWKRSIAANRMDIDEFTFAFNHVEFSCIFDIGRNPYELLIGAKKYNWACVLTVRYGYRTSMSDRDFYDLCNILNMNPGKNSLTSSSFLKYLDSVFPDTCSGNIVAPSKLMRFRPTKSSSSDSADRTVFVGWNDHKRDGKIARNFDKTECYFVKRVADFCRANNISSIWTTPDLGAESVSFPPGYR